MYKILLNNLVIDILEDICFVRCLPESLKIIKVDKRQANGIMASDGNTVYHLAGTLDTFKYDKKSVRYVGIDKEEYAELSKLNKVNKDLNDKIAELEAMIKLLLLLIKNDRKEDI